MDPATQKPPLHDAFISYSRKDTAFASKLEKALEDYTPPKELKVAQRRLDIFRDEKDFEVGDYETKLNQHLSASTKLIVVCSPNARASMYVGGEIRKFAAAKGATNIVPLLLSGIPNNEAKPGQTDDMAFPDALCEAMAMPLAANFLGFNAQKDRVKSGPYESAWYTTLASIYGISRSELEQREKKRQLRRRRITVAIVGAVMAALTTLSIVAWLQKNEAERQATIALHNLDDAVLGYAGIAHKELVEGDLYCADFDLRYMLTLAKPLPMDASFATLWATFGSYFESLGDAYTKKGKIVRAEQSYRIAIRILDRILQVAAGRASDKDWAKYFTQHFDGGYGRWPGLIYLGITANGKPTAIQEWTHRLRGIEQKMVNMPSHQPKEHQIENQLTAHSLPDDYGDLPYLCGIDHKSELPGSQRAQLVKIEVAVLPNDKTYDVETQGGLPVPFKSRQLEITGLGPGIEASTESGQWYFHAEVKEAGNYTVTATSHNDETISTTFECQGPGKVLVPLFGRAQYPTMWAWFDEPGTSWIHFQFHFADKNSRKKFVATQWTKFGPETKIDLKSALKRAKAQD